MSLLDRNKGREGRTTEEVHYLIYGGGRGLCGKSTPRTQPLPRPSGLRGLRWNRVGTVATTPVSTQCVFETGAPRVSYPSRLGYDYSQVAPGTESMSTSGTPPPDLRVTRPSVNSGTVYTVLYISFS